VSNKKKILILIDWFAPGYKAGGPIQSCVNICRALHSEYELFVLTTDTDHGETIPYPEIIPNQWMVNMELGIPIFYAEKKTLTAGQIKKQVLAVNADAVYLNLLFSPYFAVYPLWLKLTAVIKSKIVMCPRGTLYESALSLKRYKKMPLLFLYKLMGIHKKVTFHATNQREKTAIQKYFPGSNIVIADNLPDMEQDGFETCKKDPGYLKCIFIARIVPIKNLLYVLELLKQVSQQVSLSIVGPAENEAYWMECKLVIDQLPQNISVQYIGPKNKREIKELLQQHHLFLLTTTGENFGHAIFEAMLAGRPVLISNQTPWLQLVASNAGWDYPLSKPELFVSTISRLAEAGQQEFDKYATSAWQYAHLFINNPALTTPYKILFE
jgi:glycosyltransferase involved in cell wall biosynthesis